MSSNWLHFFVANKGPFIYYVSTELGGWVEKMFIFAYYQYIDSGWVRKRPKTWLRNIWMVPNQNTGKVSNYD